MKSKKYLKSLKESFEYIKYQNNKNKDIRETKQLKLKIMGLLTILELITLIGIIFMPNIGLLSISILAYLICLGLVSDIKNDDKTHHYKVKNGRIVYNFKEYSKFLQKRYLIIRHSDYLFDKDGAYDNLYDEIKPDSYLNIKRKTPQDVYNAILIERRMYYEKYCLPPFDISDDDLKYFLYKMQIFYIENLSIGKFDRHSLELMQILYSYSLLNKIDKIKINDLVFAIKYLSICGLTEKEINKLQQIMRKEFVNDSNIISLQKGLKLN